MDLYEGIELSPNGLVVALNVPAGSWHMVRALESGPVILEMKEKTMRGRTLELLSVEPCLLFNIELCQLSRVMPN